MRADPHGNHPLSRRIPGTLSPEIGVQAFTVTVYEATSPVASSVSVRASRCEGGATFAGQ